MNENISPLQNRIPKKYERIQEFFELLTKAPVASTVTDAYSLLEKTLEKVENQYFSYTASRLQGEFDTDIENFVVNSDVDKMRVEKIEHTIELQGYAVSVIYADKHYIFLGENGALEIQEGDKEMKINNNPHHTIAFEKKGADGKGVWE